jgi:hypothetical protein
MSRTETTHVGTRAAADERTVGRFREAGIALPTFEQFGDPGKFPQRIREELSPIRSSGTAGCSTRITWDTRSG